MNRFSRFLLQQPQAGQGQLRPGPGPEPSRKEALRSLPAVGEGGEALSAYTCPRTRDLWQELGCVFCGCCRVPGPSAGGREGMVGVRVARTSWSPPGGAGPQRWSGPWPSSRVVRSPEHQLSCAGKRIQRCDVQPEQPALRGRLGLGLGLSTSGGRRCLHSSLCTSDRYLASCVNTRRPRRCSPWTPTRTGPDELDRTPSRVLPSLLDPTVPRACAF